MPPPIEDEEERREVIRQLQDRDHEAKAKRLKAEAEGADAARDEAAVRAALERAKAFPEGRNLCFFCFINGHESTMYPVPHPEPARFDRWKCGNCERVIDRKTGLR
ncbi:MAG: hypothetical protein JO127_06455 [Caulobacteraceae bacterium]|nr:hypothetical protein [Caulobacteraceae bacterium]